MKIIQNIFLPEKIGTNYIFKKRIVAVAINKTTITATKSLLKGTDTTIELIIEETLESVSAEESDYDRIVRTLSIVVEKIGAYDEVHIVIPSSLVVFKELRLPFLSYDKIRMVIGFEIEPLLPFSLKDAVLDFIIIKQNAEEKSSELLVSAVQKQHIAEYVSFFEAINIKPAVVTVDTLALYSLYTAIPSYHQLSGGTALVDMGLYTTRITLMIDSQLKMIRTLPKGIISITKKAALDLHCSPNDVMEKLIRFGLEESESLQYTHAIEKATSSLWDDINFTFTSFAAQFLGNKAMTKVIVLGEGSLIKGFLPSLAKKVSVECEFFRIESMQEIKNVHINNDAVITLVNIVCVSAAIPSLITSEYNLLYKEISAPDNKTFIKQSVTLIVLTIILFASLISHYSLQISKLKKEIAQSEQEALSTLKSKFKNLEDVRKLADAIEEAEEEVKKQKETWFAFSNQSRSSFLQYLLELTSKIDAKSIGLEVEQISMAEKELILKARVKDYEALKVLEKELGQSTLFSYVEPQENLQFSMKITLATNTEEI